MDNLLLEPTKDNLCSTFLNDTIERNNELYYFVKLLNEIDGGSTIAIDGALLTAYSIDFQMGMEV